MLLDFGKYFGCESAPVPEEYMMQMKENDLDILYADGDVTERFNVYFHLQNELIFLLGRENDRAAAHVCYLISYYLFVALTPPHSEILAMAYAKKAFELYPMEQYQEWMEEVRKGN